MKEYIFNMITNPYLITAVSSWAIAQILKTIIYFIVNKKFDINRLFGDGGMPSGHSATVTSLAVITSLMNGTGSVDFAIAAILAIVVCHDAMGVRRETGKQAVVINDLIEILRLSPKDELREVKLKEFVGHTPVQVFAGIMVGIANAVIMYFLFT